MRSMSENEDFSDECLREHNRIRKNHNVKPLRHSHALDRTAQEWAEHLLTKDVVINSPLSSRGELGESISKRTSTSEAVDILGTEVVAQWYNDINSYNFQTGAGAAGNFTQMVWAHTREVGFGKASSRGQCVVVAHYRPPGNIRGRYLENVFPPICFEEIQPKKTNKVATDSKEVWKRTYTEREVDAEGNQFDVKKEVFETKDNDGNIHRRVINSYQNCDPFSVRTPETTKTSDMGETFSQSTTTTTAKQLPLVKHEEFVHGIVSTHNWYRAKHGSPDLVLNSRLSAMAQEWADYLVDEICLSNSGFTLDGLRLGENISSRWSNGNFEECGR
uniref:Golgi-associated plant pathogenesis-related protein 1 n=2 Tax=Schistocephalus solidus TaxID=70667 RepID=A0A0X3Q4X2_SCHSO